LIIFRNVTQVINQSTSISNISIRQWSQGLWQHFDEILTNSPQSPFYLVIDKFLIKSVAEHILNTNCDIFSAYNSFNLKCNTLFNKYDKSLTILEETWIPDKYNHSLVICLAAQQVLAVEEMYDDELFSNNSYFPRYRSLLQLDSLSHSCPLKQNEFKKIWETLKSEILKYEGTDQTIITFKPGRGLKEKNRNYPLSQALLSQQDVIKILDHIGVITNFNKDHLFSNIQYYMYRLGGRAKILSLIEALKEDIFCQILHYYNANLKFKEKPKYSNKLITEKCLADYFSVYVNNDGWEEESILFYKNENIQDSGEMLVTKINDYFLHHDILFLKPELDYFKGVLQGGKIESEESFYVVVRENSPTQFSLLSGLDLDNSGSIAPHGYDLYYCENGFTHPTIIKGKSLAPSLGDFGKKLILLGGIVSDERNKNYLYGHPPSKIQYESHVLSPNERFLLNEEKFTLDEMLCYLKSVKTNKLFRATYKDETIDFGIVVNKNIIPPTVGYKFQSNNQSLNLQSTLIDKETSHYFSFLSINKVSETLQKFNLDLETIAKSVYSPTSQWVPLSKKNINILVKHLQDITSIPNEKSLLVRKISSSRRAPRLLFNHFKKLKIL